MIVVAKGALGAAVLATLADSTRIVITGFALRRLRKRYPEAFDGHLAVKAIEHCVDEERRRQPFFEFFE